MNLLRSTVSGNTATGNSNTSGGIDNGGALNVTNSTISGNAATGAGGGNGGGIWNSLSVTLTNATITNNSAAGADSASGVYRYDGTINVKIIAGNANNEIVPDVFFRAAGTTGSGFASQVFTVTEELTEFNFHNSGDELF